jgi:shikimate kinase
MAPLAPTFGRAIALVGMPGAGKTSIGRTLAAHLRRDFADSDQEVERTAGATVPELFRRDGEAAFRALEHHALARLLPRPGLVLATGGGSVLDPRNRALLRRHAFTIWLDAAPAKLARRIGETASRPLLEGGEVEERLTRLLEDRRPLYSEAHLRIDVQHATEAQVVDAILCAIEQS